MIFTNPSGGSVAIGSPVSGGTATRVPYTDSEGNLADSGGFYFDNSTNGEGLVLKKWGTYSPSLTLVGQDGTGAGGQLTFGSNDYGTGHSTTGGPVITGGGGNLAIEMNGTSNLYWYPNASSINWNFIDASTSVPVFKVSSGASKVPVLIQLAASQTADALQVKDSSANVLSGITGAGFLFQNYAGSRIWNSSPDNGYAIFVTQGYALSWGSGGAATAGFRRFADNVMASSPGTTYQTSHLMGGGTALASQSALDAPTGNVFHVTGTTGITSITSTNFQSGVVITLIFDGVLTVTDGSNLKLAGDFTTSADDTLTLVYDGTNWYEIARSVN